MMAEGDCSTGKAMPPGHPLAEDVVTAVRDFRRKLGGGGLVALRSPMEQARLVAFHALGGLWRLLFEYHRRIGDGERCRLVVNEQPTEAGQLRLHVSIEAER